MKKPFMLLISLVSFHFGLAQIGLPEKSVSAEVKAPTCKLTSAELQQRKKTAVARLKKNLLAKQESESGYSYKFDSSDEMLDVLNDFIKTERMCCDFFTFQLTVDGEFVWLALSGPSGTKEFIKDELEF